MSYSTTFGGVGLFFTKRPSGKTLKTLRDIHDYYTLAGEPRLPVWKYGIPVPDTGSDLASDLILEREVCNWSLIDNGETFDERLRYELRCQHYIPNYIGNIKTLFDKKLPYECSKNNYHHYMDWLMYLMRNVFHPNEDYLYGTIVWMGAESNDFGRIVVSNDFMWGEQFKEPTNDIIVYSYSTDGFSGTIPKGKTKYNADNGWKYPPAL